MAAKGTTKAASGSAKTKAAASEARKAEALAKNKRRRNIWSVVLFAIGIMVTMFALIGRVEAEDANVWDYIHCFFCGVFGAAVFFIGPVCIYIAVMISLDKERSTIAARLVQAVLFTLLLSAAIQIIFIGRIASPEAEGFGEVVSDIYNSGMYFSGGGVAALPVGYPLLLLGRVGATIVIILIIFVIVMVMANISLMSFLKFIAKPFVKLGEYAKRKRDEYEEESMYVREEQERLRLEKEEREEQRKDQQNSQAADSEKLSRKFSRLDAMTRDMRSGEDASEKISETEKNAKEIVEQQKKDSDEYLIKIGAKSPLVPPRLTDEDYKRNEENASGQKPEPVVEVSEIRNEQSASAVSEENAPNDAKEEQLPAEIKSEANAENNNGEKQNKEAADNAPKNSENNLNEIEKAIRDYNREIEEKNRKGGVSVESSQGAENKNQQSGKQADALAEDYVLPPVMLLNEVKHKVSEANIHTEIEQNSTTLVNALKSFGVSTTFLDAVRGPSVTRYELQPAPGVKISKITGLVDDIALNLATVGVRIEAPIPGKAAVGVEVPNKEKETVFIREMIDSDAFRRCNSKLGAALGKNISGDVVICDIADMPHILVAGTTGSGKSVCVNSIIMSILFRATPDEVRLVMVDPKSVEFMIYNGIGHLLLPVVTDPKKAAGALAWACTEMDKRYNILSENNVRDIKSYNKLAATREDLPFMPQVVIFIDELADLMMCSKSDVETSICRLAQKARAAGMHLVVATQRPTVDVITGLIKANIPSRIALKSSSQTDSRTIIDMGGAEKLLGRGDMLYKSVSMSKPMRVQGCWVSDEEVEKVTDFIKNKYAIEYDDDVIDEVERQAEKVGSDDKNKGDVSGDLDVSDDKLDEAIEVVFNNGGASTSSLQRALKVGYGRAARLVDIMEQMGIVGAPDGNKPRQLLMSKESWYERKLNKQD